MPSLEKVGLPCLDALHEVLTPDVHGYVRAVSEYVVRSGQLDANQKKTAQIRLSGCLGRALATALAGARPPISNVHVGERDVAGALRVAKADVSEFHPLDGLRLAIEIKPVNLAVGRAIWNRFGDIRTFAVNVHLKFPFAVVGGLLVIPTIELEPNGNRKDTTKLIRRAVNRLIRAGGRRTEGDAPHLLEAVGVIAYDPFAAQIVDDIPPSGSGLRWDEFVQGLAVAYDARFEN